MPTGTGTPPEQLQQLILEEVTEMVIRIMYHGYSLQEIELTAYQHFARRIGALSQRPR